ASGDHATLDGIEVEGEEREEFDIEIDDNHYDPPSSHETTFQSLDTHGAQGSQRSHSDNNSGFGLDSGDLATPDEVAGEELDIDIDDNHYDRGCLDDVDDSENDDIENRDNFAYEGPLEDEDRGDDVALDEFQEPASGNNSLDEVDDDEMFALIQSTLEELRRSAIRPEMKSALDFIDDISNTTLDSQTPLLGQKVVERLRNPPTSPIDLSPDQRLSLDLFLLTLSASQEIYNSTRKAILRRHPDDPVLSYDEAKALLVEITGVVDVKEDMCPSSCAAFTGPFHNLTECPICGEDRYDPVTKRPRLQFNTIPLGPQLQALKRHHDSAVSMNYLATYLENLTTRMDENEGVVPVYNDILAGSDILEAYQQGLIKPDDFVVLFSLDGAQLYKNKESDCWLGQFIILNLAPDSRYKMSAVRPAFTIPGPNKPQHMDSFLFTTLAHLRALQKDGFYVWDESKNVVVDSNLFFALVTADGPGLVYFNGLVGHMGFNGCRIRCGLLGRRKPRDKHYYPALLKPVDPVTGCDHEDGDWDSLPIQPPPTTANYLSDLRLVVLAKTDRSYKEMRKRTGIVKPSLSLALDPRHVLPPSRCYGPDIMHLLCLNIPDIMIPLWRGTLAHNEANDPIQNWPWAVLASDETWHRHGAAVAACRPFLPSSFDRAPRNPALKLNSGFKAWEFQLYIYVLGPGLFYNLLPPPYYENLCDLVAGVRILNQHKISIEQLQEASAAFSRFALGFEHLYYQRQTQRIHFVRQSIHAIWHLAYEVTRLGPPICCSQWTMERTIGNLVRELRQPSNPYANLAQRSLLRCQINALK
ncbi:hypothetical protein H0H92_008224, partial [Tricholoma furcatifolium]